ncbi:hypothetical protein LguiB_017986 [Lonicera macranthoides]
MNALAEYMVKGLEAKENMDNNLVASFCYGNLDVAKLLSKILLSSVDENFETNFLETSDLLELWKFLEVDLMEWLVERLGSRIDGFWWLG